MINLEPIPKKIQERLEEKRRILSRQKPNIIGELTSAGDSSKLTYEKFNSRTPFLRMTSGQINPVILMGGKVDEDGAIPGGYDEIYGQRTYNEGGRKRKVESKILETRDAVGNRVGGTATVSKSITPAVLGQDVVFPNQFKRPTPGVKSIDVNFKGGAKASREATIQWTCWDWNELEKLTPHFLAHGKTVLAEWGWVYGKDGLSNLPNFLTTDAVGNRFIDGSVYNNYKNQIIDNNGDFDLMVGIVKNFTYTTRDDGGFDCTTILTSVGINILESQEGDRRFVDPSQVYNLSLQEQEAAVRNITNNTAADTLINLNTTVSLKALINQIDVYLIDLLNQNEITDLPNKKNKNRASEEARGVSSNRFLIDMKVLSNQSKRNQEKKIGIQIDDKFYQPKQAWVRWGWFEDNILSKFLSLTSDKRNDVVSLFRSVERIIRPNGSQTNKYESTRIRNNADLETVDINSYILPGQFRPLQTRKIQIPSEITDNDDDLVFSRPVSRPLAGKNYSQEIVIKGDEELIPIASLVNDPEIFKPFATDFNGETNLNRFGVGGQTQGEDLSPTVETEIPVPGKFGYLRNILINTNLIKKAFSAEELKGGIESINVFEAIQRMFSLLNQAGGLNLWSYQIVQDSIDTQRVKIIDDATTKVDFNKPIGDQKTIFDLNGKIPGKDGGIFYFPVWQADSIVKRQNVNASIPNSLQIATMYGSNTDAIKEFGNHSANFGAEGVIAGALGNSSDDDRLNGLNIAIKNENSEKIGIGVDDEEDDIKINEGDDLLTFLRSENVQDVLTESYADKKKQISQQIEKAEKLEKNAEIEKLYDNSIPTPSPEFLSDQEILDLLTYQDEDNKKARKLTDEQFQQVVDDIQETFGKKFDNGVMRSDFVSFVNDSATNFGELSNENLPQVIPFELELDIDGIGGIYPGNSFHSTYLPQNYQNSVVFQAKDVNHKLDGAGWTTTLAGVMRTSLQQVFEVQSEEYRKLGPDIKNLKGKIERDLKLEQKEKESKAQPKPQPKPRTVKKKFLFWEYEGKTFRAEESS